MLPLNPLYRCIVVLLSVLIPLLVLAAIWLPELRHYYVRAHAIDDRVLESFRTQPDDALLRELNAYENAVTTKLEPAATLAVAAGILQGELRFPRAEPIPVPLPFDQEQFQKGLPGQQLTMAALTVPRLLLEAYQINGNEQFFTTARDILQAWWAFEEVSWLPVGFLWDDHATSARIQVYVQFWSVYRHHPDYNPAVARALLASVDRNCQILARPSHFTFATNHGVMQNLALFHAAVAFPGRPGSQEQVETAFQRLSDQMKFYISNDGIATEHSLGYQDMAVTVTANALRYLSLLQHSIPDEWLQKYQRSLEFFVRARVPDGTMPMYGDSGDAPLPPLVIATRGGANGFELSNAPAQSLRPATEHWMSPALGYAVWWNGLEQWPKPDALRQTVIAWPNFISHTHKHADEMSVLFWADGQHWWNNVGYWPYGVAPRERAVSWDGSNAPHLENEGFADVRETRVLRHGASGDFRWLDLERTRPDGYRARRQVIATGGDRWFVIDAVQDNAGRTSAHNWTVRPDVFVQRDGADDQAVTLKNTSGKTHLHAAFSGSAEVRIERFNGSADPFAGWIVIDRNVKATDAFRITLPAGSHSLVSWALDRAPMSTDRVAPRITQWVSNEQWTVEWSDANGARRLSRDGDQALIDDGMNQGPARTLALGAAADLTAETTQLTASFRALAAKSEKRRDYFFYRVQLTEWLLLLWVTQELFIVLVRRVTRRDSLVLRVLATGMWLGIGGWAQFVYFT